MSLVKHTSNEEAKNSFLKGFGDAVFSGQWMAAVWYKDERGNIIGKNTTYGFPTEAFDFVIRDLFNSCEAKRQEADKAEMPPLPLAPHLREKPFEISDPVTTKFFTTDEGTKVDQPPLEDNNKKPFNIEEYRSDKPVIGDLSKMPEELNVEKDT